MPDSREEFAKKEKEKIEQWLERILILCDEFSAKVREKSELRIAQMRKDGIADLKRIHEKQLKKISSLNFPGHIRKSLVETSEKELEKGIKKMLDLGK